MSEVLRHLGRVAHFLGDLRPDAVFVGGSILPLLLQRPTGEDIRPTDDVDCILNCVTQGQYMDVAEALRKKGFHECTDEDAPMCRWIIEGIRVDIMPRRIELLGFQSQWYMEAWEQARDYQLPDGSTVRGDHAGGNAPGLLVRPLSLCQDEGFTEVGTQLSSEESG